jgi:hypothetical protein
MAPLSSDGRQEFASAGEHGHRSRRTPRRCYHGPRRCDPDQDERPPVQVAVCLGFECPTCAFVARTGDEADHHPDDPRATTHRESPGQDSEGSACLSSLRLVVRASPRRALTDLSRPVTPRGRGLPRSGELCYQRRSTSTTSQEQGTEVPRLPLEFSPCGSLQPMTSRP